MVHQEFDPPRELQDAIKCFWYNRKEAEELRSAFEVMPDGYAEIIFHFSEDLRIWIDGVWQPLPSPFLMGLLNQPASFDAKEKLEIIAVRCFPWTVFDLLGLSPDKNGIRIFKHPVAALQSTLTQWIRAGRPELAVSELQQYFLRAGPKPITAGMLSKAGRAMREASGSLPVDEIAAAAHATVRTLERNFKQSSGYSLKDVSGLIRFEQVRNRLWQDPEVNLAGLAHETGYADQSHLSREFKRYSGTTPAAFARKAKKEKQGRSSDFVAFVQS